jgi:hypothetical protein
MYQVTISYDDSNIPEGVNESNISLFNWDSARNEWQREPTSTVNIDTNTVTVTPSHFSQWALLIKLDDESDNKLYLPLVNR